MNDEEGEYEKWSLVKEIIFNLLGRWIQENHFLNDCLEVNM